MALIDVSAVIKGEADAAVQPRMIFSASAVLHGVSASGLGKRQPSPDPTPQKQDDKTGA